MSFSRKWEIRFNITSINRLPTNDLAIHCLATNAICTELQSKVNNNFDKVIVLQVVQLDHQEPDTKQKYTGHEPISRKSRQLKSKKS